MKCPHCKNDIRLTASAAGAGRRKSTRGPGVSLKKNPRGGRPQYRAKFGRKSADFYAKNDQAAERYCNGLLAHKMGGKASSLQRTGRKEPKT